MISNPINDPGHLDFLTRKLVKKLKEALKRLKTESMDDLIRFMELPAYEREMLMRNWENLLSQAKDEMKKEHRNHAVQLFFLALYNYQTYAKATQAPQVVAVAYRVPTRGEVDAAAEERAKVLYDKLEAELKASIRVTLENARTNNWSDKKTKDALNSEFRKAEGRANAIARTELAYALNAYMIGEARAAGVKEMMWVTAKDEMVCRVCRPRHGKIYPIDKLPEIPAHPNCRCIVVPV
jgi:SPP1 gp7 family putative phage head morphogenesis protein